MYESAFCAMLDKNVPTGVPVYELSSLLFFLVPMMIIIVLYVLIGLQIRQSSRHSLGKQMKGNVHGETKQIQSKKSIVRMLGDYIIYFCKVIVHGKRIFTIILPLLLLSIFSSKYIILLRFLTFFPHGTLTDGVT